MGGAIEIEREIQLLLLDLGVPTTFLGFLYLTYAIQLTLTNFEYVSRLSKMLYIDIAERYQTEPDSVERCMRHAIKSTFTKGLNPYAATIFDASGKVPTPGEFLSKMYFYLITKKEA